MDQVNLKKLAKELNLAVSTVSRALRDSYEIKQETKERVRALAEKMGYQPNFHASSLRQNKSMTIAVIVPEITNSFFTHVINGVELIAQKKHYHVLIYLTHEDYEREKAIINLLRSGRVDGLMISLSETTKDVEHLQAVKDAGMPIVLFDRIWEALDVPKVTTNDESISFKATTRLLENGCKKVAFLGTSDLLSITGLRKNGYLRAIKESGNNNPLVLSGWSSSNDVQNRAYLRKVLSSKDRPDGVFSAVEKLAINTYEICLELNLRIPEDVKVVCFSNLGASELLSPPLSTISQPAFEIGKEGASILFKLIEKKRLLPQEKRVEIPSIMKVRESAQ